MEKIIYFSNAEKVFMYEDVQVFSVLVDDVECR